MNTHFPGAKARRVLGRVVAAAIVFLAAPILAVASGRMAYKALIAVDTALGFAPVDAITANPNGAAAMPAEALAGGAVGCVVGILALMFAAALAIDAIEGPA